MTDMIPRAEADARVAAACEAMRLRALDIAHEHLARVQPHDPDDPHPVDKVAQGYGNAALNISAAIGALTTDDDRAALDQMILDAVNEATRLTVPIAALDKMLAEAEKRGEKRGMLRAAEIAWARVEGNSGRDREAAEISTAIRAEAEG